jgi:hypothetical protein
MPLYQKSIPYSPARERLRDIIAAKAEAVAKRDAAAARIEHLSRSADAVTPLRGKLAALDSSETRAHIDWTLDTTQPMPSVDAEGRAKLVAEIAAAEAATAAARRAQDALQSEVAESQRIVSAVDSSLGFAAADVALEEMADIEAAAKAAVAKFVDARMKAQVFSAVVDSVRDGKDMTTPGWSDYTACFVDATDRVAAAFRLPKPDEAAEAEFRTKAIALMADLRSDAGSRLHL